MEPTEETGRTGRVRRGDPAPGFTLPGTDGMVGGHRDYSLAEFTGRVVVLVFYPGDGTRVCTEQLTTYTQDIESFRSLDAQVLAISPQGLDSHDRFADANGGFAFPLLADEGKLVGASYGVLGPLGFYRRSVFVIGRDGKVGWVHRALGGLTFQPTSKLVEMVSRSG